VTQAGTRRQRHGRRGEEAHRHAAVSLTASLNAVQFYERFGFERGEPGERCLGVESLSCLRMTCRL
jgi:hypothetical protein